MENTKIFSDDLIESFPRRIKAHGKPAIEVKECLNRRCTSMEPHLVRISADIEPKDILDYFLKGVPFRDQTVYFTYKCGGCKQYSTITTSYTKESMEKLNKAAVERYQEGESDPDVISECISIKRPEVGEIDSLYFGGSPDFGNFVIWRNGDIES